VADAELADTGKGTADIRPPADTLLVRLSLFYDDITDYKPDVLLESMLDGAGVPFCPSLAGSRDEPDLQYQAARTVVLFWLLDRDLPPPPPGGGKDPAEAIAREALTTLRALPADEQRAHVATFRDAERTCVASDRLELLTGASGAR
jgi:hypothetical protein